MRPVRRVTELGALGRTRRALRGGERMNEFSEAPPEPPRAVVVGVHAL